MATIVLGFCWVFVLVFCLGGWVLGFFRAKGNIKCTFNRHFQSMFWLHRIKLAEGCPPSLVAEMERLPPLIPGNKNILYR